MKLLNIALLLVAIQSDGKSGAGLTTVDAATPYLRADIDVEEEPAAVDVLKSPMCAAYTKNAFAEVQSVLDEGKKGDIIKYMCNPATLQLAIERSEQARADMATEINPCAQAKEELIAGAEGDLQNYAGSMAECVKGVTGLVDGCRNCQEAPECCAEFVGSFPSDKNLKTNINFVGMSAWGIPTYTFKYREGAKNFSGCALDTESTYFGAMAQDLLELAPEAVTKSKVNGYYAVDYSKIDVDFYKIA